jgi:membrane associated rhomboid family serine protease
VVSHALNVPLERLSSRFRISRRFRVSIAIGLAIAIDTSIAIGLAMPTGIFMLIGNFRSRPPSPFSSGSAAASAQASGFWGGLPWGGDELPPGRGSSARPGHDGGWWPW